MSQINREKTVAHIEEQYRLFKDKNGNVDEHNPAVAQITACANIVKDMEDEATAHALPRLGGGFECSNCNRYVRKSAITAYGAKMSYCPDCGFKLIYNEERFIERDEPSCKKDSTDPFDIFSKATEETAEAVLGDISIRKRRDRER